MKLFGRAFFGIGIFLVTLFVFSCASSPVRWCYISLLRNTFGAVTPWQAVVEV